MGAEDSISDWIARLGAEDVQAVQEIWQRYASRLVELAARKLGDAPKRAADEDDIALSVFQSLCRGAAEGRFADVKNRDELWWLLLAITKQKVVSYIRRETAQKRGGGQVRYESGGAGDSSEPAFQLDLLVSDEPTPELLVTMEDENQRLLGLLRDDRLQQIAIWRLEGYTVAEIAERLSISERSVERKLQLIRRTWARELADGE